MCISWLQYPTCNRSIRFISYSMSWRRRMNFSVWSRAPVRRARPTPAAPRRYVTPVPAGAALALSQLEALQSKLQELEEENLSLRSEVRHGLWMTFLERKGFMKVWPDFLSEFPQACHLKTETITYEVKEQQLVTTALKSYVSICVDFQAPNQVKLSLYTVCTGVCLQKQHHKPN